MQFKRRLKPEARVELVPMIDVVFQLVIFFMVTSTFMVTPGIDLILPSSTTTEPVVMTNMVISVASQDEIYLNRDKYSLAGLGEALAAIDEETKQEIDSVVIKTDEAVTMALAVRVLDRLRLHGFNNVSLQLREDTTGLQ